MCGHLDGCPGETQERCDALPTMVRHITVTGDLAGEFIVDEVLEDGRLVIRPDTSAAAIRGRQHLDPITGEEFDQVFGALSTDQEG